MLASRDREETKIKPSKESIKESLNTIVQKLNKPGDGACNYDDYKSLVKLLTDENSRKIISSKKYLQDKWVEIYEEIVIYFTNTLHAEMLEIFLKLNPRDYFVKGLDKQEIAKDLTLSQCYEYLDNLSNIVFNTLDREKDLLIVALTAELWIRIAYNCYKRHNFAVACSITLKLEYPYIKKLIDSTKLSDPARFMFTEMVDELHHHRKHDILFFKYTDVIPNFTYVEKLALSHEADKERKQKSTDNENHSLHLQLVLHLRSIICNLRQVLPDKNNKFNLFNGHDFDLIYLMSGDEFDKIKGQANLKFKNPNQEQANLIKQAKSILSLPIIIRRGILNCTHQVWGQLDEEMKLSEIQFSENELYELPNFKFIKFRSFYINHRYDIFNKLKQVHKPFNRPAKDNLDQNNKLLKYKNKLMDILFEKSKLKNQDYIHIERTPSQSITEDTISELKTVFEEKNNNVIFKNQFNLDEYFDWIYENKLSGKLDPLNEPKLYKVLVMIYKMLTDPRFFNPKLIENQLIESQKAISYAIGYAGMFNVFLHDLNRNEKKILKKYLFTSYLNNKEDDNGSVLFKIILDRILPDRLKVDLLTSLNLKNTYTFIKLAVNPLQTDILAEKYNRINELILKKEKEKEKEKKEEWVAAKRRLKIKKKKLKTNKETKGNLKIGKFSKKTNSETKINNPNILKKTSSLPKISINYPSPDQTKPSSSQTQIILNLNMSTNENDGKYEESKNDEESQNSDITKRRSLSRKNFSKSVEVKADFKETRKEQFKRTLSSSNGPEGYNLDFMPGEEFDKINKSNIKNPILVSHKDENGHSYQVYGLQKEKDGEIKWVLSNVNFKDEELKEIQQMKFTNGNSIFMNHYSALFETLKSVHTPFTPEGSRSHVYLRNNEKPPSRRSSKSILPLPSPSQSPRLFPSTKSTLISHLAILNENISSAMKNQPQEIDILMTLQCDVLDLLKEARVLNQDDTKQLNTLQTKMQEKENSYELIIKKKSELKNKINE